MRAKDTLQTVPNSPVEDLNQLLTPCLPAFDVLKEPPWNHVTAPVHQISDLEPLYAIENGWLILDKWICPYSDLRSGSILNSNEPGDLLAWNERLDKRIKWIVRPDPAALYLRLEMILERPSVQETVAEHPGSDQDGVCVLETICRRAENPDQMTDPENLWFYQKKKEGGTWIRLDVPGSFYESEAAMEKDCIVLYVTLAEVDDYQKEAREALELLLLTVNGLVRGVRSVINDRNGHKKAGFQANLKISSAQRQLPCALAALSLACRLCDRELKMLSNPHVGKEYLKRIR